MKESSESGADFGIAIGLALIGGYADASSYLLARTFTGHLTGKRSPKEGSSRDPARLTVQVLAPIWLSFIFGAVMGAVIVSSFHSIGLLGIVLPLILLILIEMNKKNSLTHSQP